MNPLELLQTQFDCEDIQLVEVIQSLWSDYGQIARYDIGKLDHTVVLKWVNDEPKSHPRGWASQQSHQRKIDSYRNEQQFYQRYAQFTDVCSRVPAYINSGTLTTQGVDVLWLVMQDLAPVGFTRTVRIPTSNQITACLKWLAHFHATFIDLRTPELLSIGSYWHLQTRQDEWDKMPDSPLKTKAAQIDSVLNNANFKSLVHGDAKIANFCFHKSAMEVAAVDFQYVGRGVGVKDVMYFLGSCLSSNELFQHHDSYVDVYFSHLQKVLTEKVPTSVCNKVVDEWQRLYPICWADFERFLSGWSPDHAKRHEFSEKMTQIGLDRLELS